MSDDEKMEQGIALLRASGCPFSLAAIGPDGKLHTWQGDGFEPEPEYLESVPLCGIQYDGNTVSFRLGRDVGAPKMALPTGSVLIACAWDRVGVANGHGYLHLDGKGLTISEIFCPECDGSGDGIFTRELVDVAEAEGLETHSTCRRCKGTGQWHALSGDGSAVASPSPEASTDE